MGGGGACTFVYSSKIFNLKCIKLKYILNFNMYSIEGTSTLILCGPCLQALWFLFIQRSGKYTIFSLCTFATVGCTVLYSTVPEFIDPVFAKTSPKRSSSITENERFGLVFAKTGSINSGTVQSIRSKPISPQPSIPLNDWSYFADPIRIRGFNDQKLQYNLRI